MIARVLSPFSFPSLFTSSSHVLRLKRGREREKPKRHPFRKQQKTTRQKMREKTITYITVPTVGAIPNTVTSNHPPPIFFEIALKASRPKEPMISTLFEEMP